MATLFGDADGDLVLKQRGLTPAVAVDQELADAVRRW